MALERPVDAPREGRLTGVLRKTVHIADKPPGDATNCRPPVREGKRQARRPQRRVEGISRTDIPSMLGNGATDSYLSDENCSAGMHIRRSDLPCQ